MRLRGLRPGDYTVVHDRCWYDAALDAVHPHVYDRAHPAPVRLTRALQHLAAVRSDQERRTLAGKALCSAFVEDLDVVRSFADGAASGDRFADADVVAFASVVLVDAAWSARGGGRASTVSADAFDVFHRLLDEADEVAYRALQLDPWNPLAAVARLDAARGLGLGAEEFTQRFDTATKARPTLYGAHTSMLQTLCKKWLGSTEVMFDFARRAAANAPVGDPIGAILAIAHVEHLLDTGGTLSVPAEDLHLARYAADRWISGGEAALRHPHAPAAHQLFGWLLREEPLRMKFHLERSMGRIGFFPWQYLEGDEKTYRKLLVLAKVDPARLQVEATAQ